MISDPAAELRGRGLQVTAQRLAVLRTISATPHLTAEAVTGGVRAQIGSVSVQTVYDALATLVEVGLVRRIQPAGSAARFEDRVADNHHHLVCRDCGCVVDVDCVVGCIFSYESLFWSSPPGQNVKHLEIVVQWR